MSTDKQTDLKARIAWVRNGIAYADRSEKESRGPQFSPELRAKTKTDCDDTRTTAKALLRILLAELELLK